MFDRDGPALRCLSLGAQTSLDVLLADDRSRRALLLKVPKEYDFVSAVRQRTGGILTLEPLKNHVTLLHVNQLSFSYAAGVVF